ncbi:hypothetical protein ABID23_001346 [Bartonella silvatica]|uniref:Uncharacterized protein n=1 Tax=Bartonella silvatica TaxID=357760 RepID=A0ABV2HJ65_9HYPH
MFVDTAKIKETSYKDSPFLFELMKKRGHIIYIIYSFKNIKLSSKDIKDIME